MTEQNRRAAGRHTAAGAGRTDTTQPPSVRPARRRLRRGAAGTALAVLAVAALTASQAPGVVGAQDARDPWKRNTAEVPYPSEARDDGAYHTELPPLATPESNLAPRVLDAKVRAESGIPATVLTAYKNAQKTLKARSPGCGLPWQLLAAIGKVESGQARGGAVTKDGTTTSPILGPVLDGKDFALIKDTDGGALDGNSTYDRAVGPMQFIPSTWRSWASDGNGDGKKDPHNIHDAALAAGRYLCADGRDLSTKAGLRRAILSYNHSDAYLRTVLAWLDFYRKGVHTVPDGEGVLPGSPGAGGDPDSGPGKKGDKGKDSKGSKGDKGGKPGKGGGKRPGGHQGGGDGGTGGDKPGGDRPGPGDPGPGPADSASPGPTAPGEPDPTQTPGCPDDTGSPSPSPTETTSPTPTPSPSDDEQQCPSGQK